MRKPAGDVYVDGASNILTKPDFVDIERMRDLFRTFEEKSRLIKILNECVHDAASLPRRCTRRDWARAPGKFNAQLRSDHRALSSRIQRQHRHARRRWSDEN